MIVPVQQLTVGGTDGEEVVVGIECYTSDEVVIGLHNHFLYEKDGLLPRTMTINTYIYIYILSVLYVIVCVCVMGLCTQKACLYCICLHDSVSHGIVCKEIGESILMFCNRERI